MCGNLTSTEKVSFPDKFKRCNATLFENLFIKINFLTKDKMVQEVLGTCSTGWISRLVSQKACFDRNVFFEDVGMEIMPTCGYQDDTTAKNTENNINTYYQHKPRNGECLFFHPMIRHRVGTNNSDLPRVSLAFDLRIG